MATTSRTTRARLASGAAVLLAGLSAQLGLGVALGAHAQATTHSVVIKQYAYSPASLSVDQGDTVTWTNQDSVEHDVKVTQGPASFQSPLLGKGESWSHTFSAAGTYSYICSVHPDMKASVSARAKATAPAVPAPSKTPTHAETHSPAAAATSPSTRTASQRSAQSARDNAAAASAQAAAPAETQQLTAPLPQSGSTLDPLLLVAGASTAVMVFCLLLMTSRPAVRTAEDSADVSGTGPRSAVDDRSSDDVTRSS
jgi:plastocyanin